MYIVQYTICIALNSSKLMWAEELACWSSTHIRAKLAQRVADDALVAQQAAQLEAQLQAERAALEARALQELQAAQEQVLTSRRQLQQQLEEETNRAVQDGLNALGLGGLLGN